MATLGRLDDARATHLEKIAHYYAEIQPGLSTYWGSELNDLKSNAEATRKKSEHRSCPACGSILLDDRTCTTVTNTAEIAEAELKRMILAQRKDGRVEKKRSVPKSALPCTTTTCLRCRRYTKTAVKQQEFKSRKLDNAPKIKELQPGPATQTETTNTVSVAPNTKAKRKQKKGGLAAMLARSKETSSNSGTRSLGFADFARKT